MTKTRWFYECGLRADFEVLDEDAADFLQSQFSNELRPFEMGRATYGLWLDVKGKVLGDSIVLCQGESLFRVCSEGSDGATIRAHLERHIIADDVEINLVKGGRSFEAPAEVCAMLDIPLPAAGHFLETEYGCLAHAPESCYRVLVDSDSAATVFRGRLVELGCAELSTNEYGLLRIAAGRPLVPVEIGPADLPGEGELERTAISFTKGCYLGQEVVARMHNLGQAQRQLFVVEGGGVLPALPMALYDANEKRVGEVRSAYSENEGWLGVALLKRRFVSPGDELIAGAEAIKVLESLSERRGK